VDQPFDAGPSDDWMLRPPDGREWIAQRVGTWIIDAIHRQTGKKATDFVWVSAPQIADILCELGGIGTIG